MPSPQLTPRQVSWARRWMTLVLIGLFVFIIGVEPDLIGMDKSPVVGFVQVGVWLIGLALLLVGCYATVYVVRNGQPNSLRADIGLRFIATGYVVAAAASLADFIGLGAQSMPEISFGPIQVIGLVVGVILSLLGVVLYWPRRERPREKGSHRFPRIKLPSFRRRTERGETPNEKPNLDA
ncbi:MAG: hypothetical protein AMJ88_05450 [Anaerolineae bacterium SM23_ 63]|nr:MAG: hypothetical protein AMJ88_05450 [Anaerolineae bacterium SM23_ 63]HEY46312.1 hypothetical protein [Anaerolineae bacterium]